jgi:tRNA pseudouridine38-40 synthase
LAESAQGKLRSGRHRGPACRCPWNPHSNPRERQDRFGRPCGGTGVSFRCRLAARTIQIVSVRPAAEGFHARFSAKAKIYTYRISLGDADPFTRPYCWTILKPLDLGALRAAAGVLEGRHDFKAFSALNGREADDRSGTVRDLRRFEVNVRGRKLRVTAEADGFLYKMVRSLVGAIVAAGEGKLTAPDVRAILSSGVRTAPIQTAPAQGLFLERVLYH